MCIWPNQIQESLHQARDISSHVWDVASTESIHIYGQGVAMVLEGYSMLPAQVREYTDPALRATSHYSALAFIKVKEGCNQGADVIIEQYNIYSPTIWEYCQQAKARTGEVCNKV